jgi:hypothetical protein
MTTSIKALNEIRGGRRWDSRSDFVDEVQRRVNQDMGHSVPVRDRIDEILDTFMSRDDSP